ncbi:MAG: hypothetical protein HY016_01760 [Nitrosomonadales bacterium]|nr:hypothetical protein [Nitrosomonadales bacterium]
MIDFIKIVCALSLFALSVPTYPQTNAKPVQIIATGMHYGGYVIYRYQVKNNGTQSINRITLGNTGEEDSSFVGFNELPDDPAAPDLASIDMWYPPSIISCPDGWGGKLITEADEGGAMGIDWIEGSFVKELWPQLLKETNAPQVYPGGKAIASGQTSSEFSVKVERPDYAYVRGYASVIYGNDILSIPVEKGDTAPPALTVSAIPAVIWPPNNKMVDVVINLAVKDDYDPQPEIQLVSISSNEVLAADDIQGAQYGADDRQFSLRATRTGTNLAGRIYTITYSATDGSGNKSTVSTTVTVPHDQR